MEDLEVGVKIAPSMSFESICEKYHGKGDANQIFRAGFDAAKVKQREIRDAMEATGRLAPFNPSSTVSRVHQLSHAAQIPF